jgi:L,D-transpeptidase YcbB
VPSVSCYRSFQLLFLFSLLAGCASPGVAPPAVPASPAPVATAVQLHEEILHLLEQKADGMACCSLDWGRLESFYQQQAQLPVWWNLQANQRKPAADELLAILTQSTRHGLDPADYHEQELRAHWSASEPATIARRDLLLTDAFLAYTRHLSSGRYAPQLLDPKWHILPQAIDSSAFLRRVVDSAEFRDQVEDLAPPHSGYRRLQRSLQQYHRLAADIPWPLVDGGPLLRPGERDLRVHDLRERLRLEGYPVADAEDEYRYDEELEAQVQAFQARHGLKVDGVLGAATLAALNASPEQRIWQILLNMERWRWLPRDLGERYLMVNMAGFNLQAVERERVQLDMRVIIGTAYRTTPAFIGNLSYLVVNPEWNLPRTILREDVIPRQRENPDYLASQNIRVLANWQPGAAEIDPADIDWQAINPERVPYRLRQDPGPGNSLGRLKFMLPNEYDIYLHDTPSRHLFAEAVRTFSSGCIRLEQPLELADYLLGNAGEWDRTRLLELIESGATRTLRLARAVPVYILYWTAWVDDEGLTHFMDDIYGLDRSMAGTTEKQ